jgi:hypothetical protein
VSFYDRAKETEQLPLYRTYYRHACSMAHGDVSGLMAQCDDESKVDMAPSFKNLDHALVSAHGSIVRCLNYFDEIARLGFEDRLG